ncbi:hypothetical protein ZWY2020_057881 [Hordeum vulgare]|nr:hypothetical protein ZWY2020_057881 [Hordeum vulgare]
MSTRCATIATSRNDRAIAPAPPIASICRCSSSEAAVALLANIGPLLIGTSPTTSPFRAAQLRAQQEAYQEEARDNYTVKPPMHDFPRFDGSAPYLWIDRCEPYF